jgi:hypothetical protein
LSGAQQSESGGGCVNHDRPRIDFSKMEILCVFGLIMQIRGPFRAGGEHLLIARRRSRVRCTHPFRSINYEGRASLAFSYFRGTCTPYLSPETRPRKNARVPAVFMKDSCVFAVRGRLIGSAVRPHYSPVSDPHVPNY